MKQGYPADPVIGWYRIRFDNSLSGDVRPALLIGGARAGYDMFLNGKMIGSCGGIDSYYKWGRVVPQLFEFRAKLLRPADNLLAIRMQRVVTDGGLRSGPMVIADQRALEATRVRLLWRRTIVECGFIIFYASTLLFSIVLYALGCRDRKHVWFAVVILQIGLVHLLCSYWFDSTIGVSYFSQASWVLLDQLLPVTTLFFLLSTFGQPAGRGLTIGMTIHLVICGIWWMNGDTKEHLYIPSVIVAAFLYGPMGVRVCLQAARRGHPDAWPLLTGGLGLIALMVGLSLWLAIDVNPAVRFLIVPIDWYGWLCLHLSMIYTLAAGYERNRQRLKVTSQQLLQSQDAERARVSRELHDGVGQSLTALKLGLELVNQRVGRGDCVEDADTRQLVTSVDAAIDEVHRVAVALRPEVLEKMDFAAAVRLAARNLQQQSTLTVAVDGEINLSNDKNARDHLYRIVQETLQNVVRHADATIVDIRLKEADRTIVLEIADDGCGFDASNEHAGLGLISIRERTDLLGGRCKIVSGPDRGTTITVEIPQ